MNKKVNTIFFILGATLFNVVITVLCCIGLMVIYGRFIMRFLPESGRGWGFPIIFIAAIALSFCVYRFILKLLIKKVDIEKYFDPIFASRRKPPANS